MSYLHWLDQIRMSDRVWAGEKAAHLGELIHAGFDIPRGLSITAEAYGDTLAANQIDQKISTRLGATEIDDPVDLEQAAEEIRTWIESASIPAPIAQELKTALDSLDAKALYAVRASRVVDDVPNPAASGMQQAYLGIPHGAVLDHMRKCWTVPWNSRAIYFRYRKKIDPSTLTMAVVVQPMLSADAAGVMFTANPLTGKDEIHIDATWGLGEAIIAARWKPDHFVVEKNSHAILERVAASKNVMELVAPSGGLQSVAVAEDKQDDLCLSDEQVAVLAAIGERVAAHFQSPQDIEWCCVGDKFFLLQTRPLEKR
jgi:phosphoenolpyruvate synthase/pyruvate phosphate dikinase